MYVSDVNIEEIYYEGEGGNGPRHSRHNIEMGRSGETAAAHYLERSGYEILERNWECQYG
jgi:hypothetical protein